MSTVKQTKAPALTAEQVKAFMANMSDEARQELLHGMKQDGIKISTAGTPKEKVYVAERVFLKDSNPNARNKYRQGDIQKLTEKSLMNVLTTWVRKDADVRIPAIVQSVKSGHKETFTNFEIRPLTEA